MSISRIVGAAWSKMDLPLKFPNNADVIAEEAARWRALSPEERMRSFRGMLEAGTLLMQRAPNQEFLREYRLEQRELAHKAIKELIARHAERPRESRS